MAREPERQAEFYREMFNWEIGAGPIMQIPAGLGGPEPGPAGHMRMGDQSGVLLYIQVSDLTESLKRASALGGKVLVDPFDAPGGPTLAFIEDPEGNGVGLVQQ